MEASRGSKLWPHLLLRDKFKAVYVGKGETQEVQEQEMIAISCIQFVRLIISNHICSKSPVNTK